MIQPLAASMAERNESDLVSSIHAATREIEGHLIRTPLIRLRWLDHANRRVWAKMECLQHTGSFKIRGAMTALSRLRNRGPVVSASAGNHGLAVAAAAVHFDLPARIYVPTSASEVKVRRLLDAGAEVLPRGRDLFEAIRAARGAEHGAAFVSPFDDPDVVAGQGTLALELYEQRPAGFDHAFVPFGGGGLLTGFGTAARQIWPRMELHAVYPAAFGRSFDDGYDSREMNRATTATLADGLACQHDGQSWLSPLIARLVSRFHQVDEDAIKGAIFALLVRESVLTEGAGAISLAPLFAAQDSRAVAGDVLVIISGGNQSISNVAKVLTSSYPEPDFRKLLGLREAALISEIPRAAANGRDRAAAADGAAPPAEVLPAMWRGLVHALVPRLAALRQCLADHKAYLAREGLDQDAFAHAFAERAIDGADEIIAACGDPQLPQRDIFRRYRLLIQQYAFANRALRWCSASSDHSREVMLFDPAEVQSATVNYDRYGSNELDEKESLLLAALGFDDGKHGALLTSSGQAAYATIESFLLREVFAQGPRACVMPYIYFEAMEQLSALPFIETARCPSWSIEEFVALVEATDSHVAFIDPVANNAGMDRVDLRALAQRLRGRDWSRRWLVIDGTMVSGGFNPFEIFHRAEHPRILYYESASKYVQFGLDLQMGGLIVVAAELAPRLRHHRRNCGTLMYPNNAAMLPPFARADMLCRMRHLTANAELLAAALRDLSHPRATLRISYPDDWRVLGWMHGGGVVAATFSEPGLNNRPNLEALVELMIRRCREAALPLTKGVSFGFGVTRVSAAAAVAGTIDPFLRFAVGEEPPPEFELLVETLRAAVIEFLERLAP
jgi:threonine dehydratase